MTHVIIHDSLMGTGKSTRMIEHINNQPREKRYIIVAPFLSECHRYAGTTPDPLSKEAQEPLKDAFGGVIYNGGGCNASGREFKHPMAGYRNKVEDIARLVELGEDIVTTHAALKLFTPETKATIKDNGYTLVIDEELECVNPIPLSKERRLMLLNSGLVDADEDTGRLIWVADDDSDGQEDIDHTGLSWDQQIKKMCKNGSIMLVKDDTGDRKFFMWEYPAEFITAFDNVEVLTYLAEGSLFEQYLKLYRIPYTISKGIMLPSNPFGLINVVDNERMNRVGVREESLSATHQRGFRKHTAVAQTLKKNMEHFFNNSTYGKSIPDTRLWTCLKDARPYLKGKGYTKRWIAQNTKAVNTYRESSHVSYAYNVYMHPDVIRHMSDRGFTPNEDVYALSQLLQFVYRSRVRCDGDISLYLPNQRMRDILERWMKGGLK